MSHKGGRKSQNAALVEDKEKKATDTPVKEMKKKIAANAEKEKQATDKTVASTERIDKNAEKVTEKPQNEKTDNKKAQNAEKVDKNATLDKNAQKLDKNAENKSSEKDKNAEKTDKSSEKDKNAEKADKKTDKVADKKDKPAEKKNETEKKEEAKGDGKDMAEKPIQNGAANGDALGTDTVSDRDSSEDDLVIDDLVTDEQDEAFPELTYDDTSDGDEEGAPSRSFTRRSQSKEKLLKMTDSLATDRKLRSADSPKRDAKKPEQKKAQDSPKKDKTIDLTGDEPEKKTEKDNEKKEESERSTEKNQLDMEVVVEMESIEESSFEGRVKTRARVSPYTARPPRHDQTTSSMMANYTGNNTTMEMDITESSIVEEPTLDDSAYLRGLKSIRGRSSYKPLKELSLKHTINRSTRSNTSANTSLLETARPTGTVVGRKRKPDAEDVELASEAAEQSTSEPRDELLHAQNKRMRLFDRFPVPFRGFHTRRAAEIVGINTDLPLTAPVASTSAFDPETLKASEPVAVPLPAEDKDNKRCSIM